MEHYKIPKILNYSAISKFGTKITDDMPQKDVTLKNNAPFRSCITKIINILRDNPEGPDIVMPIYNWLWCSDNYSMTSGSLWNYYSMMELLQTQYDDDHDDDAPEGKVI